MLQAILYQRSSLHVLNQLLLPHQEIYDRISSVQDAWRAIHSMSVRGAPAIAIVAALSIAVELAVVGGERHAGEGENNDDDGDDAARLNSAAEVAKIDIFRKLDYLVTSRPTAVNLADAARKLRRVVERAAERAGATRGSVQEAYIEAAERMLVDDVEDNERIGRYGAEWIVGNCERGKEDGKVSVLTHCNTGSLATAGYGTALGVVRSLHARGSLEHVFYSETRPYNQGSRLTGYELLHDGIPATLITDSMAAALLCLKGGSENIVAAVVGADRVAANGDTANKIGTYALSILARHHKIKFLVAAPKTTIDLNTTNGEAIVIEERPPQEMTMLKGPRVSSDGIIDVSSTEQISIAPKGTRAWNPAFDVTPAELIDGIVTENGVVEKGKDGRFCFDDLFNAHDRAIHSNGQPERMPSPSEGP